MEAEIIFIHLMATSYSIRLAIPQSESSLLTGYFFMHLGLAPVRDNLSPVCAHLYREKS